MGEETLNLINSTVRSLDRSLKCFDTAKKTATDALKNATMAYNVSKEAKEVRMYTVGVGLLPLQTSSHFGLDIEDLKHIYSQK